MEKLKIGFECNDCKNCKSCPTPVKNRNKEISEAIKKKYLPVPFIENSLPKNVHIEKECVMKKSSSLKNPAQRTPKVEWFHCNNCFSRSKCKFEDNTRKFLKEKFKSVDGNISSPLLSAPWIDSNVYCDNYQPEV